MSKIDQVAQALLDMTEKHVLWTNVSPESSQGAQTIQFYTEIGPDDIVGLETIQQSDRNSTASITWMMYDSERLFTISHIVSASDGAAPYITRRNYRFLSNSQLNIGEGYHRYFDNKNVANSSAEVLLSVYLVKGVVY